MARMIFRISAAVAMLLLAGSAFAAPDLQEPHRACLQLSVGGHTWYYDIRTDVSGTTMDRWTVDGGATYVDRNTYAAFHLPEGGRATWDEGVGFASTMQSRNVWVNTAPINTATWVYDANAGEDTMTWKSTVNGGEQDFIFRTSQCQALTAPGAGTPVPQPPATTTSAPQTDVPSGGQVSDAPASGAMLRACLQASSGGVTMYYEIHSDPSNDAAGTTLERYSVAGGVDTFVDSNTFAALRAPDAGLSWSQGIQFADTMQSRGVWVNTAATTAATIAHDSVSGQDTLVFSTTVNGGKQDYTFATSQCR